MYNIVMMKTTSTITLTPRRRGRRRTEMKRMDEKLRAMSLGEGLRDAMLRMDRLHMTYVGMASELERMTGVRVSGRTICNWLHEYGAGLHEDSA